VRAVNPRPGLRNHPQSAVQIVLNLRGPSRYTSQGELSVAKTDTV
jgi:hypothetical protein